jgi:hypothetical protein
MTLLLPWEATTRRGRFAQTGASDPPPDRVIVTCHAAWYDGTTLPLPASWK